MSFNSQPWRMRYLAMGDAAEKVFVDTSPLGKPMSFGFRRPEGVRVGDFPQHVRHTPDYITPTYLVEVMGLGRDGILKLKVDKYESLKVWTRIAKSLELFGLVLFIWNSHEKMWLIVNSTALAEEVRYCKRKADIRSFEDGNQYYALRWERLKEKADIGARHTPRD